MNSLNNNVLEQDDTTKSTEKPCATESCSGIYGLRNKTTGKWYVGYSKNISNRWMKYKKRGCRRQPKIFNALKKYGFDDFEKVVLETCSTDRNVWEPLEKKWITFYDSVNNGYNISEGGQGGGGIANKGRKRSVQSCINIGNSSRGRTHTEEHKMLMRNKMKLWLSTLTPEERRQRVQKAIDGRKAKCLAKKLGQGS